MSSKIKSVLFGIFLMMGSIAQAAMPATTISDPSKSILVTKEKPQFSITLSANPTTGYSWMLERYSARYIRVISHHYEASKTSLMGAGGTDVWTFEVKPEAFTVPQILKINMLYARPWNINDGSKKAVFNIVTH